MLLHIQLTIEPPGPAGPLVLGEGDAAVVVAVVQLELPGSAMQHLPPRGREVPRGKLGARDEAVGGVDVDLGEQSLHAARHVEPHGVVDVVLVSVAIGEVLGDGRRLHARRVQPRGGEALPLAVLNAALEIRDDGVEWDLVRRAGARAETEAAVRVWVGGWGGGREAEKEEEEARGGERQGQCQRDGGRRRGLPRRCWLRHSRRVTARAYLGAGVPLSGALLWEVARAEVIWALVHYCFGGLLTCGPTFSAPFLRLIGSETTCRW